MPILTTPDGVALAVHDFGGDGPDLLLAHATGFHSHAWLPVAERLRDRFRCVSFDQRGHGDSPTPPDRDFSWWGFAEDALAVCAALGLDRPFAAGHSCGGALLLMGEERHQGSYRAIYAYEPIVYPVGLRDGPMPNPLAAGARRRREVFASRQEAYENYASKLPFSVLSAEGLHAYVDHGFDDLDDGSVRLKCRGEDEALTYENSSPAGAYDDLRRVGCPVTLACGSDTTAIGPAVLALQAERLPHVRTEVLDGLTHFGPLQAPDVVAASIAGALSAG